MTRLFPSLALIALSATPAAAQDSDEGCRATWEALTGLLTGVAMQVTDPPDAVVVDGSICSATHLTLDDGTLRLSMARLGWQGLTPGTFTDLALPDAFLVTVDDLRVRDRLPGSPVLNWAVDAQQARDLFDLRLQATWDADTGRLEVAEASIDFPGENRIALSFAVRGLDYAALLDRVPPSGDAVFEGLTAEIMTNGLFETYALMPLAQAFLDPDPEAPPPEAQFAALQAGWAEQIGAVPSAQLDPDSRDALIDMLDSLPNPSGLLTLVVAAGDGVDAADMVRLTAAAPDTLAEMLALIPQVGIAASWQDSAAEGP